MSCEKHPGEAGVEIEEVCSQCYEEHWTSSQKTGNEAGLKRAAAHVRERAMRAFDAKKDEEAKFLRALAQEIEALT